MKRGRTRPRNTRRRAVTSGDDGNAHCRQRHGRTERVRYDLEVKREEAGVGDGAVLTRGTVVPSQHWVGAARLDPGQVGICLGNKTPLFGVELEGEKLRALLAQGPNQIGLQL